MDLDKDTLGSKVKAREKFAETQSHAVRELPIIMRLDGKAFHSYTKGLKRPYDENLSRVMIETTRYLVDETHAKLGYTQSDELSLILHVNPENELAEHLFGGRYQKLQSVLASMATAKFNSMVPEMLPSKKDQFALFDCRAFQMENLEDTVEAIRWREDDAIKNSISMAAQSVFSHSQLQGKKQADMLRMLSEAKINFEDYPTFFKRGTYLRRQVKLQTLPEDVLKRIPEKFRPNPDLQYSRSVVEQVVWPRLPTIKNRVEVIFNNVNPVVV